MKKETHSHPTLFIKNITGLSFSSRGIKYDNFYTVSKAKTFFAPSVTCIFQITSAYLYIATIKVFFHHKLPLNIVQDILCMLQHNEMPLNEFNFCSWSICIKRSGCNSKQSLSEVFKPWKELHSISLCRGRVTVLSSAEKQGRKGKNHGHCNLPISSCVFRICVPSKPGFDYIL